MPDNATADRNRMRMTFDDVIKIRHPTVTGRSTGRSNRELRGSVSSTAQYLRWWAQHVQDGEEPDDRTLPQRLYDAARQLDEIFAQWAKNDEEVGRYARVMKEAADGALEIHILTGTRPDV